MSGFHPVASGSIPGSGFFLFVCLYSSVAERSTCNAQVRNSILRAGFFVLDSFSFVCLYSSVAERSTCNAQVRNSILRAGFFVLDSFFLFACIAQWQSGALVMLRSGIQSSVQASFFVCCFRSSVGRAPALHAGGLGFDPRRKLFWMTQRSRVRSPHVPISFLEH